MNLTIYQTIPNNLIHQVKLVSYIEDVRISDETPTILMRYF